MTNVNNLLMPQYDGEYNHGNSFQNLHSMTIGQTPSRLPAIKNRNTTLDKYDSNRTSQNRYQSKSLTKTWGPKRRLTTIEFITRSTAETHSIFMASLKSNTLTGLNIEAASSKFFNFEHLMK